MVELALPTGGRHECTELTIETSAIAPTVSTAAAATTWTSIQTVVIGGTALCATTPAAATAKLVACIATGIAVDVRSPAKCSVLIYCTSYINQRGAVAGESTATCARIRIPTEVPIGNPSRAWRIRVNG
jgi:hypothetical protein